MSWVEAILSRLFDLWPFIRVQMWQRGVRTTFVPFRGTVVTVLEPGWHLKLWWMQTVVMQTVIEQVYNLPTQTVTCKCGAPATLSANFTFEVTDAEAAVNNVFDLPDSLNGLAMMHVAKKVRDWTWDELIEHQSDLERSIRDTLTTRAKAWGVRITAVGITDLVKARAYRLYGDPMVEHG